jgi:hypothetical protein
VQPIVKNEKAKLENAGLSAAAEDESDIMNQGEDIVGTPTLLGEGGGQ